jgi:hypothetical protein
MFLTADELKEMTKRTQHRAQVQVLRALGIEHKVRPDGSVLVLRSHVEKQLGGGVTSTSMRKREPNWSAI